ncbi:hypothetical protein NBRGN_071_00270 [Nocardia brasiliensis NBRC 14402]|uniref:bestrophin-like domain n=1 Tax=Nocardia brasiliensis TaxID=37326 RepID=UPI0002FBC625|nr:DUF4239 domain-containing protein [Nocardia brasiliensis]ASF06937.1 DUF4239 domain-containing protein [Nocardia brasiliensis]GAJ84333.1 hypothetical protein NBRGN_071_00270 [Nocardia brasiliensis NBRC 14402]SUB47837.1 Uncharacterised protein [Nocardia brasiliensis]
MAQELLVAIGAATIAVSIFVVGDMLRPNTWRHVSDESASTLALDLAKTFFTAVVAFVFVTCWQQNQNAYAHTITESKGLVDTYWAAKAMPEPEQRRLEAQLRAYTDQVIGQEWPMMENENRLSPATGETLNALRADVVSLHSADPAVTEARSRALAGIDRVTQARHDRAIDAERRIPEFLYITLLLGAIMVMLNPVLSGMQVTWRSIAMTALLGLVIGGVLLAIHDLERPFAGAIRIPQDAFTYVQSHYEGTVRGPEQQ